MAASGLVEARGAPVPFLQVFIPGAFKSNDFASAHSTGLTDQIFISAHSKGLADWTSARTLHLQRAMSPDQKHDYPSALRAPLRVLRVSWKADTNWPPGRL